MIIELWATGISGLYHTLQPTINHVIGNFVSSLFSD